MEEQNIIQKLRERAETVPVPLELPDNEDLVDVEEALLLPIPRSMRQFLMTVSDVVCGPLEPVTAADPQSHTYLPEMAALAWDEGMPRQLLPLCASGGGYYCVAPGGEVGYWRDGDINDDEHWESVWDWAEAIWLNSAP